MTHKEIKRMITVLRKMGLTEQEIGAITKTIN